MKILITGANGQLGTEVCNCLKSGITELGELSTQLHNAEIIAVDVDKLDITNQKDVMNFVLSAKPDAIINCAAFTNVDACETNSDAAFKVNALGPRNLAMAANAVGAKILHISTDYVLSGEGTAPASETELTNPQSVYGKTKRLGEQYVAEFSDKYFIFRTAWLYGYHGANFVKTIRNAAIKNGSLKVVDDQVGNPTNAADLAYHMLEILTTDEYGVYHCTGEGICSWYDFAAEIVRLAGIKADVSPCTTDEFPRPAKRPAYSALDNQMLKCTIGNKMRDWKVALAAFFENYKPED